MCMQTRRHFIGRLTRGGLLLTPLTTALSGCTATRWPEGMKPIHWNRDTCVRCNMVISMHRFAAELRGGPQDTVFKFDDPGCLVFWLEEKRERFPWMMEPGTRMWVAEFNSQSRDEMLWLEPRQARYINRRSPMGYNHAATAGTAADGISFEAMRQHTLARGK